MPQQMTLTPQQLAVMSPNQRAQYVNGLPPSQRALVNQQLQAQVSTNNRLFMRKSIEKIAYCPVAGGSGVKAAYSPGATLVFDLPVIGGGYATGLIITFNLTFTPASAATGIRQSVAAPFNIFQELDVNYNGAQIRTHPYIMKLIDICRGHSWVPQAGVIAQAGSTLQSNAGLGLNDVNALNQYGSTSNIQTNTTAGTEGMNNVNYANAGAVLAGGTQVTWVGKMYLPFNALARDSVPGVLPVMGVGNKPQLKLFCSSASVSLDPFVSPLVPTSNVDGLSTGFAGNINVDMVYLDGTNLSSPTPLQLDIEQEPTLQYYWDTPLNPFSANLLNRQHIATLLEHAYVFSVVLDGQANNGFFMQQNNLVAMDLSPDSVGQINFVKYGANTNVSINDWFHQRRREVGQDFDPGVIPWIVGTVRNIPDPDNHNGVQFLNMRPGGYPAATHAYQVSATGGQAAITGGSFQYSAPTPRVETLLVSLNYDGLRLA